MFFEQVVLALSEVDLVSEHLVESLSRVDQSFSVKEDIQVIEAKSNSELKLKQLQLEEERDVIKLKQEHELQKIEVEARAKISIAEAREREADALLKEAHAQAIVEGRPVAPISQSSNFGNVGPKFNVVAYVKLVPHFQDKDLEAYFTTFEHSALTLEWPKDKWTILLSTVLTGKAQIAYANMDAVDKYSYEKVKGAILKSYELVPETYRQNFRTYKKSDNQTWVEYLKNKERRFDKWTKSRKVDLVTDMRNLIILEDFRNNAPRSIRMHLDDLDVIDAEIAAKKADDYTVTHKLQGDQVNMREGQVTKGEYNRGKTR